MPPSTNPLLICKFHVFSLHIQCSIKSIYFIYVGPNGEVRQVLEDFRVSNIEDLYGGKVIIGTDENGVPNERSASILGQDFGQTAEKP